MEQEKGLMTEKRVDGLSWYISTESFNSIINGLTAHYNRELLNLKGERRTEDYQLHCRKMLHELRNINDDLSITNSLEKMEWYIDKYGPLLKHINTTEQKATSTSK
jgi:hypothetical protein